MQLFLSTLLICHYVSFHSAATHSHLTIRNFLGCSKRVLRWWQIKPGGKHPSLVEVLQWLQTLDEQVLLLFCVSSASSAERVCVCARARVACYAAVPFLTVYVLQRSCSHSHPTYSTRLSLYMQIWISTQKTACNVVHPRCDTVSAYHYPELSVSNSK